MKNSEIARIINTLGKGEDSYYVYMLCEKVNGINVPFYIGKGSGNRIFDHEMKAEKELLYYKEDASNEEELMEILENELSNKNKKINALGTDNVIKVIVKWGLTEDEANMAESTLINAYHFTGGKNSLTNIINGHMSEREKDNIACTTKARTTETFLEECAVQEKCITELDDPVLFVKITNLYPLCMLQPPEMLDEAIYDSCRACWILNKSKVDKIKYVFALYNSQVVGIYSVTKDSWKQRLSIDDTFPQFPPETRELEKKYAYIAKNCATLAEMKNTCDNYDEFLSVSKISADKEKEFASWKNRYYFIKSDTPVPEHIKSFENSILVKPNGDKFFSGRGTQSEIMYNFDIIKNHYVIRGEDYYNKSN